MTHLRGNGVGHRDMFELGIDGRQEGQSRETDRRRREALEGAVGHRIAAARVLLGLAKRMVLLMARMVEMLIAVRRRLRNHQRRRAAAVCDSRSGRQNRDRQSNKNGQYGFADAHVDGIFIWSGAAPF